MPFTIQSPTVRVALANRPSATAPLAVIIPARNEAAVIGATLRSWCAQRLPDGTPVDSTAYELILVANNCTDATVARAITFGQAHPYLQFTVLNVSLTAPQANVGTARLLGGQYALDRCTHSGGQLFFSDADTLADPYLVHGLQCAFAAPHTSAVGAYLSTGNAALGTYHAAFLQYEKHLSQYLATRSGQRATHNYFSGAGMGITRAAYRDVGGIRPLSFNEDKQLRADLESRDHQIAYPSDCVVHTSCRQLGRVSWGMSKQLAQWVERERAGLPLLVPHPGHALTRLLLQGAVTDLRRDDTRAWHTFARHWWPADTAHRYLRSACHAAFQGEAVGRVWHCPNFVQQRNARFPVLPVEEALRLLGVEEAMGARRVA